MPPGDPSQLKRTDWAERHVEDFLSLPLIREFVFRSPQALDANVQKEVVDFLIAHGDVALLISQKCQDDPSARTGQKLVSWACKAARHAVSQLRGALRTVQKRPVWCEHSRRGRVDFLEGLPKINHAIVTVEVSERVDLASEAGNLPLEFQGTPISYFSLNDFLNLAVTLRTTSELLEYLNVRRSLPADDLRVIGDEKSLFECYVLGGLDSGAVVTRTAANAMIVNHQNRLQDLLKIKSLSDRYSTLLEHVADELATRLPNYATGLPDAFLQHFDPPDAREGYLKMQGILANLRLRERAELGRAFDEVIERLRKETEGFIYKTAYLDSIPSWVFVFASSKSIDRAEVLRRMMELTSGAMAFYGRNCMIIIDRDHVGYEVGLGSAKSPPTDLEQKVGERLFGHLRTSSVPIGLRP